MKRKLTEVEYNQLSAKTIISTRIRSSTTSKYKGQLKKFSNFLGLDDIIDVMDRITIDHINEENINNWFVTIKSSKKGWQNEESFFIRHYSEPNSKPIIIIELKFLKTFRNIFHIFSLDLSERKHVVNSEELLLQKKADHLSVRVHISKLLS